MSKLYGWWDGEEALRLKELAFMVSVPNVLHIRDKELTILMRITKGKNNIFSVKVYKGKARIELSLKASELKFVFGLDSEFDEKVLAKFFPNIEPDQNVNGHCFIRLGDLLELHSEDGSTSISLFLSEKLKDVLRKKFFK